MDDVAALAHVSKATISRYLNSPSDVSPHTRQKIAEAIKKTGYMLRRGGCHYAKNIRPIVALMIPTVRSSLFASTTFGVEKTARKNGFHVLIGNTHYSAEIERDLLDLWLDLPLSGVILTGFFESNRDLVNKFMDLGIPCTVTYEVLPDDSISYVGIDNFEAARRATDYLLSLGHVNIATIMGPFSGIRRTRRRLEGYRHSLESHGISVRPDYIIETEPTLLHGKEATARLLALSEPPTAIFCAGDALAMGAIAQAKEVNLDVPQDISIMGFDDIEFAAVCSPPLTTVRLPSYQMGQLAMNIILDSFKGNGQPRQYKLETDVVIRASCSPRSGVSEMFKTGTNLSPL